MKPKNKTEYIRSVYERYRRGDSISTREMQALYDHLEALAAFLAPLPDMSIVHRAVCMDLAPLRGYLDARKNRHLSAV